MHDPEISVIVPARDVEPYVGELLEDLASQRCPSHEVILVNDGSTDRTPEILQEACRKDPRFQLIETPGVGPGAARNAGVECSVGRYLAFIDSDDRVSERHLAALYETCTEHDVPFAVASGERLRGTQRFPSAVYRRPFSPPVPPTSHITRRHGLLYDTTMHSKLIERDFWLSTVGHFPEGTWHEDTRPSLQLHLAAPAVGLVDERSYLWRVRSEGEPSITQRRGLLRALEGRIQALAESHELLTEFGDCALLEAFLLRVLRMDLALHLKHAGSSPDAYIDRLQETVAHYLELAGADVLNRLGLNQRAGFTLLLAGRRAAVRAAAPPMMAKQPAFDVQSHRSLLGRPRLRAIPREPSRFSRRDLRILGGVHVDAADADAWATTSSVMFRNDELHVRGRLGLERLRSTTPRLHAAVLFNRRDGKGSTVARAHVDWDDDPAVRPGENSQGISGQFRAAIPIGDLLPRRGKSVALDASIEVTIVPGHQALSRISVAEEARHGSLVGAEHHGDRHSLYPYVTKRGNLSIQVWPRRYQAVALSTPGSTCWPLLFISGCGDAEPHSAVASSSAGEEAELPIARDGSKLAIDLRPLCEALAGPSEFSIDIVDADGRSRLLGGPPRSQQPARDIRVELSRDRRGITHLRVAPEPPPVPDLDPTAARTLEPHQLPQPTPALDLSN